MTGCCGGNADALLAAKRFIEGQEIKAMSEMANSNPGSGMVRLKFVGDWEGPVQFKANGRVYYGANAPLYKFCDAPPEDAEILVRTGKFEVMTYVAPEPPKPVEVVPMPEPPKVEPVKQEPKKPASKKGSKK